jgi:hypothetical protein
MHSSLGQNVFSTGKEETVVTLKMKERSGNVYENKGPLWKKLERSRNITDSKGDTPSNRECC